MQAHKNDKKKRTGTVAVLESGARLPFRRCFRHEGTESTESRFLVAMKCLTDAEFRRMIEHKGIKLKGSEPHFHDLDRCPFFPPHYLGSPAGTILLAWHYVPMW